MTETWLSFAWISLWSVMYTNGTVLVKATWVQRHLIQLNSLSIYIWPVSVFGEKVRGFPGLISTWYSSDLWFVVIKLCVLGFCTEVNFVSSVLLHFGFSEILGSACLFWYVKQQYSGKIICCSDTVVLNLDCVFCYLMEYTGCSRIFTDILFIYFVGLCTAQSCMEW